MHYWAIWLIWRRAFHLVLLAPSLITQLRRAPASGGVLASGSCCNDGWYNGGLSGTGGGCCGNGGIGMPNGNVSGLYPPGIFEGGFINDLTNSGNNGFNDGAGFANNNRPPSPMDFVGKSNGWDPDQGRPPFSQDSAGGSGRGFGGSAFPNYPNGPFTQSQGFLGQIPGLPQAEPQGGGSFVGPPPPFPRQPVGPLRPQLDNKNGADGGGNRNGGNNRYDNDVSIRLNRNRFTDAGSRDEEDTGLKHPFESPHDGRRRRRWILRSYPSNIISHNFNG